MRTLLDSAAALLIAALLSAGAARADDPPFVGKWSLDPNYCSTVQEDQNAPLVIAKDRYDQHESHCTFKSSGCTSAGSGTAQPTAYLRNSESRHTLAFVITCISGA